AKEQAEVPDVKGMSPAEAKNALQKPGLTAELRGEGEAVLRQLPPAGETVRKDTKVILYTE
ncbi:MAG: PASTA domain-containing protein, partial [Anaerotignum sp.]|nr:PASTA domain-containing protein [Anaerotignum sp.]